MLQGENKICKGLDVGDCNERLILIDRKFWWGFCYTMGLEGGSAKYKEMLNEFSPDIFEIIRYNSTLPTSFSLAHCEYVMIPVILYTDTPLDFI